MENVEKDINTRVVKSFTFENFDQALSFVNKVGGFADQLKSFPDLDVDFNKVKLTFNSMDQSSVNDFLSQIKLIRSEH